MVEEGRLARKRDSGAVRVTYLSMDEWTRDEMRRKTNELRELYLLEYKTELPNVKTNEKD